MFGPRAKIVVRKRFEILNWLCSLFCYSPTPTLRSIDTLHRYLKPQQASIQVVLYTYWCSLALKPCERPTTPIVRTRPNALFVFSVDRNGNIQAPPRRLPTLLFGTPHRRRRRRLKPLVSIYRSTTTQVTAFHRFGTLHRLPSLRNDSSLRRNLSDVSLIERPDDRNRLYGTPFRFTVYLSTFTLERSTPSTPSIPFIVFA